MKRHDLLVCQQNNKLSQKIMNRISINEREQSLGSSNCELRLANDNFTGSEYDGTNPLFRRIHVAIHDEDICQFCLYGYDYWEYRQCYNLNKKGVLMVQCTCHENKRVNVTQCIISVSGDARNVKPHEAVYMVKVLTGASDVETIITSFDSIDTPVCEFSIMDSLNTWDENPHLPLVQKYLRSCTDAQMFRTFRGSKSARSYILAFDTLLSKILESARTAGVGEQKANPHIGRKKKK